MLLQTSLSQHLKHPTPNLRTFNTLKETTDALRTTEPLWIQSKVPHTIDSVAALCRTGRTDSYFTVHQYVVHPTDTLSSLLGSVHEEGKHLFYEKTPFSHMLQQPNTVILIHNSECNPLLARELEGLCLTRSVIQNGEYISLSCKLIIVSKDPAKLMRNSHCIA